MKRLPLLLIIGILTARENHELFPDMQISEIHCFLPRGSACLHPFHGSSIPQGEDRKPVKKIQDPPDYSETLEHHIA